MKFRSETDKARFLLEVKAVPGYTEDDNEQVYELFFKNRKKLVGYLKDFKKSQATRGQWRKNRYKIMKGIKSFHKSTKGKRYHRAMSRFLMSRDFASRSSASNNEGLKALSSLETHLYIEREYYSPNPSDEADIEILLEEVLPTISRVKKCLMSEKNINSSDMEMLLRITESSMILAALANEYGVDINKVEQAWENAVDLVEKSGMCDTDDGFYLEVLKLTKQALENPQQDQ